MHVGNVNVNKQRTFRLNFDFIVFVLYGIATFSNIRIHWLADSIYIMPQKPRLHKVSGKSVIKKCPSTLQNTANENSNELNNAELNQQFETELCWCIQQLQIGLKSQKLNTKQGTFRALIV